MKNLVPQRRMTKQKSAILSYLKSTKIHPSAEMVYDALKVRYPNMSLSTVYRNLSQLNQDNMIEKLIIKSQVERFDGDIVPHNHFICEECGAVYDLFEKNVTVPTDFQYGVITGYSVSYYGFCNYCKCKTNENKNKI